MVPGKPGPGTTLRSTRLRGVDYLPSFRRWTRVRRSILRCFFFDMRLRRFLMTEPICDEPRFYSSASAENFLLMCLIQGARMGAMLPPRPAAEQKAARRTKIYAKGRALNYPVLSAGYTEDPRYSSTACW